MQSRYEFAIWKESGETPLAALGRFKRKAPGDIASLPMTYAGRLDPLASGVLPVIAGYITDEAKLALTDSSKEYQAEILLGISSDSDDLLGIVEFHSEVGMERAQEAHGIIVGMNGPIIQEYPAYSSAVHEGKPLWEHARSGLFPVKRRATRLNGVECGSPDLRRVSDMSRAAISRIRSVSGDFRQDEAVRSWEDAALKHGESSVVLVPVSLDVDSGFYVRSFARSVGIALGMGGIAWSIIRTRAGRFASADAWREGDKPEDFLGAMISS